MPERDHLVTLYLRNMPARLVREAKARAAREGSTLSALVTSAIARFLVSANDSEAPTKDEDQLRESMDWYKENLPDLLERYQNEYVAILDGAVIDHDEQFEPLAKRVFDRIGIRPVFMPRVTSDVEHARIRSPRLPRRRSR
jgi:hypothetical protein